MDIKDLIKELDEGLIVNEVKKEDDTLYIYCERKKQENTCKYCGCTSSNIHSIYVRKISDLPIQNYKVKLVISVKKYKCNNSDCKYTTFAEELLFVDKNAIRTKRLDNYINDIGLKNSSIEAKKNITKSHVKLSHNTVLRIVKKRRNINSI